MMDLRTAMAAKLEADRAERETSRPIGDAKSRKAGKRAIREAEARTERRRAFRHQGR